jgi:tRNA 2-thiouridine synthesizing protein C
MNSNPTKTRKKVLIILTQSPYNGSLSREAIDYCLAAAAFEQDLELLFTGDAVLQLIKDQNPSAISQKNLTKTLSALPIYGINKFYVDSSSLVQYGINDNLCLPTDKVDASEISVLLANADTILNF